MTLRYLLDTNIVSAPFKTKPSQALLKRLDASAGQCCIGVPTWHELRFGHALLPASRRKEALGRYLHEVVQPSFPVLLYDRQAAEWHAQQRARLRLRGQEPSILDGMIAAIAAANDLIMVTNNVQDFSGFLGLSVENWLA